MNYKKIIILLFAALSANTQARNIAYVEDIHMQQASPELVGLVAEVADDLDFLGDYEVVEPRKAGLATNAWNRLICSGVNPQTANNYIAINPEWFKDIPKDQQKYLIGTYLTGFDMGPQSTAMKIAPFVYLPFFWLFIFLAYLGLNKTSLANRKKWVRVLLAYAIAVFCKVTILDYAQQKYVSYLQARYSVTIYKTVMHKMDNKEPAIKALNYLDVSIKKGLEEGEEVYRAQENSFADLAKELHGKGHHGCCSH
jgi:hypothetical protein